MRVRDARMSTLEVKTHQERPIPPRSDRELYDHVGWSRPVSEGDLADVLGSGPAVGAWDGEVPVGFVRALSDGHLAAYVEDVMVREGYRGSGVGEELMARLLREVGDVANVSLFCEPPVASFYERSGFRRTSYALMQRSKA
jgi:GNAT superfamily N-acetyltransferase